MRGKRNLLVAIIQPYIPHYREPIFNLLSRQQHPLPEYMLYASTKAGINIKTSEIEKATILPEDGGLNWQFTKTFWIEKLYFWQSFNIPVAFSRKYNAVIYPGYMYDISTWISIVIAKSMGKRTIMWTHGYVKKESGVKGWLRNTFYKLSDCFLLYGNYAKEIMRDNGFKSENLYVVYNSLDYERQCLVRDKLTDTVLESYKQKIFEFPELPVLLYIGRLTHVKKLDMIIESIKRLADNGICANLLFIGNGPEQKNLEAKAKQLDIAKYVVFYGPCYSEEDIGPLISLADICVSPGEIGLTCMHSLVYGTPVITHDNPDSQMPEWEAIQPGKTGALFRQDDVKDLTSVIEAWLKQKRCRKSIRNDCQDIIDKYYNPKYQLHVINSAVSGIPATQLSAVYAESDKS
ncbi:MAG: glycosyltransferase family 4 protein [Desulfuromonadales bacterium]|nr:glycosyltransferase family 4 protein [Desulfuromonadales bacterium]